MRFLGILPRRFITHCLAIFFVGKICQAVADEPLPDLFQIKKVCQDTQGRHIEFTAKEVLDGRYPDAGVLLVSDGCKQKANGQINQWIKDDLAHWDQLANQACSAALGWVEKVPGTCQAGGPPPLCPVDHWEQRPWEAQDKWKEQKEKIRKERLKTMVAASCDCYLKELQAAYRSNQVRVVKPSSQGQSSSYRIPCKGDGDCPPGYSCQNEVCVPLAGNDQVQEKITKRIKNEIKQTGAPKSEPEALREQIEAEAMEKVKEEIRKEVIAQARETAIETMKIRVPDILKTMEAKVVVGTVAGILESTPTSLWKDSYKRHVREFYTYCNELVELNNELDSFYKGKPARAPDYIKADIARKRAALIDEASKLNNDYNGVVVEKELGACGCEGVFQFKHQLIMQSYAELLTLLPK